MIAWWWPNDAKLAAPRLLVDEARMRGEVLPQVVAALSDNQGRLLDYRLTVVQYVPEDRLCARVDLQWAQAGAVCRRGLYVKSSREPDVATAFGLLRAVHNAPESSGGRLRTPRPVLVQPQLHLHWQEAVPGRALLDLDRHERARLAHTVGGQLAVLHSLRVDTPRCIDSVSARQRLHETTCALIAALDGGAADVRNIAVGFEADLDCILQAPNATLHGDLHARNVLVDADEVALIDLDGLRLGHPAFDLGGWIADSMYYALLDGRPPHTDRAMWQGLMQGYVSAGGRSIDPQTLAWATAWHLFCQRARRCVCNIKPGRPAIASQIVRLAASILQSRSLESV